LIKFSNQCNDYAKARYLERDSLLENTRLSIPIPALAGAYNSIPFGTNVQTPGMNGNSQLPQPGVWNPTYTSPYSNLHNSASIPGSWQPTNHTPSQNLYNSVNSSEYRPPIGQSEYRPPMYWDQHKQQ
jgi:hypothetical protein